MIRWFERHYKISFVIFLVVALFIVYISSKPYDPVPKIKIPLKPVIYHLGVFFLLALFLMMSMCRGKNIDWIFFSVIFAVFYAITDELHQFFIRGRAASSFDIFLDSVGALFAFMIYMVSVEWRNGKIKTNLNSS